MELEEPAQGVFAVMSCIEEFLNVPVMIQLKAPIVAAVSDRPVTLESGVSCGYAIMAPGAKKEQDGTFPILLQILCGSIDLADEKNVILTTVQIILNDPLFLMLVLHNQAEKPIGYQHPLLIFLHRRCQRRVPHQ